MPYRASLPAWRPTSYALSLFSYPQLSFHTWTATVCFGSRWKQSPLYTASNLYSIPSSLATKSFCIIVNNRLLIVYNFILLIVHRIEKNKYFYFYFDSGWLELTGVHWGSWFMGVDDYWRLMVVDRGWWGLVVVDGGSFGVHWGVHGGSWELMGVQGGWLGLIWTEPVEFSSQSEIL